MCVVPVIGGGGRGEGGGGLCFGSVPEREEGRREGMEMPRWNVIVNVNVIVVVVGECVCICVCICVQHVH